MSTATVPPPAQRQQIVRVALAGNPNSGKTTLFNALTGARQHVGNYPGVTVERKEGKFRIDNQLIHVIDLPGTYSLTAYSPEEVIARSVLIQEQPDVVVHVIDASNLERNLYLTTQLMELAVPLVLAFNMTDVAEARGYRIDMVRLSELLRLPIVTTVGHRSQGMAELKQAILQALATPPQPAPVRYSADLERQLDGIVARLAAARELPATPSHRWYAIKLLENDPLVSELLTGCLTEAEAVRSQVLQAQQQLLHQFDDDAEMLIADGRYGFISGACQEAVLSNVQARHNVSDRIDMVMTNRLLGLPIFLGLMYLVFHLTFTLGEPPMGWIESWFGWLGASIASLWPAEAAPLLKSLILDGIIGGVGGVVVFLPNILLLFLGIAFLEDTGYMARAAFIMDKLMHKIGLHGKSFIPMLIGLGCSVPAIMATRTLENQRDRLTTILVTPLISCGARLPIYALIIPAFFPSRLHAPMLWTIYLTGIILAIICAKLLRSTVFKGSTEPFVMELPPYRVPTLHGLIRHMWDRAWLYLKKAGTVILGISIILWALTTFPQKQQFDHPAGSEARQTEELAFSVAGRLGHAMDPVLAPMGFDWKIGTALVGAFAAKEVFVAQMGIVYSLGEAEANSDVLRQKLAADYSPLVGFCIMLFCLISTPCVATIAVTRRESNSWSWALAQLGGLTVLAYLVTVTVYQIGTILKLGIG